MEEPYYYLIVFPTTFFSLYKYEEYTFATLSCWHFSSHFPCNIIYHFPYLEFDNVDLFLF